MQHCLSPVKSLLLSPWQSVCTLPVSGWILKAGMALSLCIRPYLTFPLAPSSASTACTCNTKVPVGWFSSTDACSRYCWHWDAEEKEANKEEKFTLNRPNGETISLIRKKGIKEDTLIIKKATTTGLLTISKSQIQCHIYKNSNYFKKKQLVDSFEEPAVNGSARNSTIPPMNICPS